MKRLALLLALALAPAAQAQTLGAPVSKADLDAAAAANLAQMQAVVPSLAPVKSVNAMTGMVTVPTFVRQANLSPIAVSTTTGLATYTFATPFASLPGCYVEINATSTSYVFAQPVTSAKSTTSVTINVQAALKVLNVSLGALMLYGPPPVGTTANFFCIAPSTP